MGVLSSRTSRAAGEVGAAAKEIAQAFGIVADGVNEATASATGLFDSFRTKVDAIDIPSITFSAKVAAAFSAYIAIEGVVSQKRISTSLKTIEKHLEVISRHAEAKANSDLAGKEGFDFQILDFADKVAGDQKSRFILVFHPSNRPEPAIRRHLSKENSEWKHINPEDCFVRMFHDWGSLVACVTCIRGMPDYRNPEPICILFPSISLRILQDNFYNIPGTGGLDPDSVLFYGQVDHEGTPLTWLPAELTVSGVPVFSSANVSDLGFVSLEKKDPTKTTILFFQTIFVILLVLFKSVPAAQIFILFADTVFSWMCAQGYLDKEIVLCRKRSADGNNLMISRTSKSDKFKEAGKGFFKLEQRVASRKLYYD